MGRRWLALVALLATMTLACAPARPSAFPAPVDAASIEQIPVDLDVVVRVDLQRMRQTVDPALADALGRLLISQARAPEEILLAALATTDKLWLGFRPDADPRRWDNVIILEGDFSAVGSKALTSAFGSSRDLGAGFRVYDDPDPPARTAPARLYTHYEKKWLIASEAEIDALERVVERHHLERTQQPPERGLISILADLSRLGPSMQERSPKAAAILERARALSASIASQGREVVIDARMEFERSDDAKTAAAAGRLFSFVLGAHAGALSLEAEGKFVVVQARFGVEQLKSWSQ